MRTKKKATVRSADLKSAVRTLREAVNVGSEVAELRNISLRAYDDKLMLFGNDMIVSASIKIPARVSSKGTGFIPADTFMKYVPLWHDDLDVVLTLNQKSVIMSCMGDSVKLPIVEGQKDFHDRLPKAVGATKPVVAENLTHYFRLCSPVCDTNTSEESDPTKGIRVNVVNDTLKIEATDKFRAIRLKEPLSESSEDMDVVIDERAGKLFSSLLGNSGQIFHTGSHFFVKSEFGQFSVLRKGTTNYPDISPLFLDKRSADFSIRLATDSFLDQLKKAAIINRDRVRLQPPDKSGVSVLSSEVDDGLYQSRYDGELTVKSRGKVLRPLSFSNLNMQYLVNICNTDYVTLFASSSIVSYSDEYLQYASALYLEK